MHAPLVHSRTIFDYFERFRLKPRISRSVVSPTVITNFCRARAQLSKLRLLFFLLSLPRSAARAETLPLHRFAPALHRISVMRLLLPLAESLPPPRLVLPHVRVARGPLLISRLGHAVNSNLYNTYVKAMTRQGAPYRPPGTRRYNIRGVYPFKITQEFV